MPRPRVLAFVLPQFHRIPENDEWWGEGFTEWTNVRKAKPQFVGHRQPRVPQGGRYYDLLDAGTREWQADIARRHRVDGFCYYHYWFGGRRLLEQPIERVLALGKPDFPFCFSWANEPWTRRWDGSEQHVLMPQHYGERADWVLHYRLLERFFRDPRYIRHEGKPMLLFYRAGFIPEAEAMFACWRELAQQGGLPGLHLVNTSTAFGEDARRIYDAVAEFEPFYTRLRLRPSVNFGQRAGRVLARWSKRYLGRTWAAPDHNTYRALWHDIATRRLPADHYPGAFVDWDNTARKSIDTAYVVHGAGPGIFRRGFSRLYEKTLRAGAPFIFVNAWNEWAEGTYLEPDEEHGHAYLEAIRDVVESHASASTS